MTGKQIIKKLKKAGWKLERINGSHHTFSHVNQAHIITVPMHTGDLKKGMVETILKKAGLK